PLAPRFPYTTLFRSRRGRVRRPRARGPRPRPDRVPAQAARLHGGHGAASGGRRHRVPGFGDVLPRCPFHGPVVHRNIHRPPCRGHDFALKSADMAVPQIRRAWAYGSARAVRLSLVLDLVVGFLIVLALPLASVTI